MDESGGWVTRTVLTSLLLTGAGLLFAARGAYQTRMAWTMSADEYVEWLLQRKSTPWARFWLLALPRFYTLWSDRLLLIAVTLFRYLQQCMA